MRTKWTGVSLLKNFREEGRGGIDSMPVWCPVSKLSWALEPFILARPFPGSVPVCLHWGTPEATVGGMTGRSSVMFPCMIRPVCDPFPESCLVEVQPRMSVIPKILGSRVDKVPEDIRYI